MNTHLNEAREHLISCVQTGQESGYPAATGEYFRKQTINWANNGVCFYSYVTDQGWFYETNTSCHYGLRGKRGFAK